MPGFPDVLVAVVVVAMLVTLTGHRSYWSGLGLLYLTDDWTEQLSLPGTAVPVVPLPPLP